MCECAKHISSMFFFSVYLSNSIKCRIEYFSFSIKNKIDDRMRSTQMNIKHSPVSIDRKRQWNDLFELQHLLIANRFNKK